MNPGCWSIELRSHVDEADDGIVRLESERTLDRLVIRGVTRSPHGAEALSKRREHDAVSGGAGRKNLLDDRNSCRAIASCGNDDDERGSQRLVALAGTSVIVRAGGSLRQRLGQDLTKALTRVPLDENEAPGLEPTVIRSTIRTLDHGLDSRP